MIHLFRHLLYCVAVVCGLLAVSSADAQRNVYILNDTTPQTVSIVAGVDRISYWDQFALLQSAGCVKEVPIAKIRQMSLCEPINVTNISVPQSYKADLDFDIVFDPADARLASHAEIPVTDEADKAYSDFADHTQWLHTVVINYGGSQATVEGNTDSLAIKIVGNHVTITSQRSHVAYLLRGQSDDGSFKLYGADKFEVVLDNVKLTNTTGPAINSQCKKRMFLELAEGSINVLTDSPKYQKVAGEDQKGCVFSEGQICISGSGQLIVNGHKKNGIASDQYVHIIGGFIRVNTTQAKGAAVVTQTRFEMGGGALHVLTNGAASKGIASDSLVSITGGKIVAICTGDALWSDDKQDYSSSCALKSDRTMTISNAELHLLSTGTGGKCISAGELVNSIVPTIGVGGEVVDKIEIKKDGSSSCSIKIAQKVGDLIVSNSKLWCKTSGMRPERKISFSNAESALFFYPGEDATSTKTYTMLMSASPKAIKAANNISLTNCETYIRCSGGNGGEGIEAKSNITIVDTKVRNLCFDDGINAAVTSIYEKSDIFVYSYDNDGIDSKLEKCAGALYCIGGAGSQRGIDTDNGQFNVPEGTRLASFGGNAGHTPRKGQNSIMAYVYGSPSYLTIVDSLTGVDVVTLQAPSNYHRLNLLVSVPEIQLGRTYHLLSFKTLNGGTEQGGFITSPIYDRTTAKVEYTFTTAEPATVLTKADDSKGDDDDQDILLGTVPYKIVSTAFADGAMSIAGGAVCYTATPEADANAWWYVDAKGADKRRFRNVATGQCIAAPTKEYSIPQLIAADGTAADSWWVMAQVEGAYQLYLPKGTSTRWYLKTKNASTISVDRYTGNSTYLLIDKNGQPYEF